MWHKEHKEFQYIATVSTSIPVNTKPMVKVSILQVSTYVEFVMNTTNAQTSIYLYKGH